MNNASTLSLHQLPKDAHAVVRQLRGGGELVNRLAAALSFIAATMLFIPCAATIAVMRQETGSWGWTLFGVALLLAIALGAAALVYQACRMLGFGMG